MLNFRSATLLFLTFFLLGTLSVYMYNVPIFWLGALMIVYLSLLAYGSIRICSGFYVKTHCYAKTKEKKVALSFDDGPDSNITPILLDILKKNEISASFFLTGKSIENNKDLVKRIIQEGHIIGSHSNSHSNLYDFYSPKRMVGDLLNVENLILELTGKKTKLFRPPFGVTNPAIWKASRSMSYDVIGWSIRSYDTAIKDKKMILKRITRKLHPGAIILLHDTQAINIELLPEIIDAIHSKGYKTERLDQLLEMNPYK
jgi:peptidoglycan/xylan/chitin deacetylase (PgdA/CDA1 family)